MTISSSLSAQKEYRYYIEDARKINFLDEKLSMIATKKTLDLSKKNKLIKAMSLNRELFYLLTILSIYEANKALADKNGCVSAEAYSKVMIVDWRKELKKQVLSSIGHYNMMKKYFYGKDFELIEDFQQFSGQLLERYSSS
tara:strand:- start:30 stop:452 length:423 start_codon:yes stop_codon:yes gene_type:complete